MPDLFLEYFSEEIPSRMQKDASIYLRKCFEKALIEHNLSFGQISSMYSSRRLVINIENIPTKQPKVIEELRGPRFGSSEKAIQGFLKANQKSAKDLFRKETQKGFFWFLRVSKNGEKSKEIISKIIRKITLNFQWPKSQRWGSSRLKWVRPLKRINVLFNQKVVKFNIDDEETITTSNKTFGHPLLSHKEIKFKNFSEYLLKLKQEFVIVDPVLRKKMILKQITKLTNQSKLNFLMDEQLLDEIVGIVEWPNLILGKIEKKFMNLPDEILLTVMKRHQKYLSFKYKNGSIAPFFATVSNMRKNTKRDQTIRFGNERVLRARLEDARFFWDSDRSKNFSQLETKLKSILFFEKLGTLYDKTKRISVLSDEISKSFRKVNKKNINRACRLCKIDLTMGMVNEFPELQGIMGGYYSYEENSEVSKAIFEHYLPQGNDDEIPTSLTGKIVSLADKIDTLVGFFSIGLAPSGSKDPYGLRRAALGIIRIIIEGKLSINIEKIIKLSFSQFNEINIQEQQIVHDFLLDRLKFLLRNESVSYDIIASVIDGKVEFQNDLLKIYLNTKTLSSFMETKDGADLKALWIRVSSILSIEEKKNNSLIRGEINSLNGFTSKEIKLIKRIKSLKLEGQYLSMLKSRSKLSSHINNFFDNHKINDPDLNIRKRRFKIISLVRSRLLELGNLYSLEG